MGVTKTTIQEGDGPQPTRGQKIGMLYEGFLRDDSKPDGKGKKFDGTDMPGRGIFDISIGVGQVIKGWDEGVPQMKLGEKARLDITSDYAYGDRGFPPVIPAKSDLIFEVELKKIY